MTRLAAYGLFPYGWFPGHKSSSLRRNQKEHLVIFSQLDKLISFSSLSFKEDIEDEEPWAPQDIRGAVS